ncbi:MAG: hypothetical protein AB1643_00150 [Patescibacteria group bacterium]
MKNLKKIDCPGMQFRIFVLQLVNHFSPISFRDLLEKLSHTWPCSVGYFDLAVAIIGEMSACFNFYRQDDHLMLQINKFGKDILDSRIRS